MYAGVLYYNHRKGRKTLQTRKGKTMKELKVNDWMEMEMIGYLYFAVYAISETEWWLIGSGDTYEEAYEKMEADKADAEEGDDGEWMVIDFEGKKVEG